MDADSSLDFTHPLYAGPATRRCPIRVEAVRQIDVVPQLVNFFTNTLVEPDGKLTLPPHTVLQGGYVELAARTDLICVVSSCALDPAGRSMRRGADGVGGGGRC
jgi:hypothetical protein